MDAKESSYSRETVMRLARTGALITVVCAEDACAVCRAREGKVYKPFESPLLPLRGCLNRQCRCRYMAVDPQTELTVAQLVERGVYALRGGQKDLAQQLLRRVVALDEMYESGWLWLSGVVDELEKVTCLEKVLSINPENKQARAGLDFLRKKLAASEMTAPASQPVEKPASMATPLVLPMAALEVRQEREVIVEEWFEFLNIALRTDPQMLLMQGSAFLKKIGRLNAQALEPLHGKERLDELELQWQESEKMGKALAGLLHDTGNAFGTDGDEIRASLRQLAQKLLEHRNELRDQLKTAKGSFVT